MNTFNNPSSILQIFIRELLARRLKHVKSSWIREFKIDLSESGIPEKVTVGIEIPFKARTPFQPKEGIIITKIENGKTKNHLIRFTIKI